MEIKQYFEKKLENAGYLYTDLDDFFKEFTSFGTSMVDMDYLNQNIDDEGAKFYYTEKLISEDNLLDYYKIGFVTKTIQLSVLEILFSLLESYKEKCEEDEIDFFYIDSFILILFFRKFKETLMSETIANEKYEKKIFLKFKRTIKDRAFFIFREIEDSIKNYKKKDQKIMQLAFDIDDKSFFDIMINYFLRFAKPNNPFETIKIKSKAKQFNSELDKFYNHLHKQIVFLPFLNYIIDKASNQIIIDNIDWEKYSDLKAKEDPDEYEAFKKDIIKEILHTDEKIMVVEDPTESTHTVGTDDDESINIDVDSENFDNSNEDQESKEKQELKEKQEPDENKKSNNDQESSENKKPNKNQENSTDSPKSTTSDSPKDNETKDIPTSNENQESKEKQEPNENKKPKEKQENSTDSPKSTTSDSPKDNETKDKPVSNEHQESKEKQEPNENKKSNKDQEPNENKKPKENQENSIDSPKSTTSDSPEDNENKKSNKDQESSENKKPKEKQENSTNSPKSTTSDSPKDNETKDIPTSNEHQESKEKQELNEKQESSENKKPKEKQENSTDSPNSTISENPEDQKIIEQDSGLPSENLPEVNYPEDEFDEKRAKERYEMMKQDVYKDEEHKLIVENCFIERKEKIKPRDFIDFFRARYDLVYEKLKKKREIESLYTISRLKTLDNEVASVIGMVTSVRESKKGSYVFDIEDKTGNITGIMVADNPNLNVAEIVCEDDIAGFVGLYNGQKNLFLIDRIVYPDMKKLHLKKYDKENLVAFISDVHVGNEKFTKKDFLNFINFINGKTKNAGFNKIGKNVKYLMIAGDLLEGVGIYPGQENDLIEKNIKEQVDKSFEYLKMLRDDLTIIIGPGNHDPERIAEPQPIFPFKYFKKLYSLENVFFVTNPAYINILNDSYFPGFDFLMYHGGSIIYYANKIPYIVNDGGLDKVNEVMKQLLLRRHLASAYGSTQLGIYKDADPLFIKKDVDFFVTGHIHKVTVDRYNNIDLVNPSCWVEITDYQEKMGLKPDPSICIVSNLKTRKNAILDFKKKRDLL